MASILVDGVAAFARDGVSLRSGRFLRADMLVFAVGCKNTSPPPFLAELGAGAQELIWFQSMASCQQSAADVRGVCPKHAPARAPGNTELYNYAFLGPSGRIGTASDVTYGYVPVGPKKAARHVLPWHGVLQARARGGAPCCTTVGLPSYI